MQEVIPTIFRTTGAFLLLLLISRLIGRKLISEMTFFDFLVAMTIGTITGTLATDPKTWMTSLTALLSLGAVSIIIGFLHIKSMRFRKLVVSEPVVLIEHGNIVDKNMKKTRLTINELMMHLRDKDIFNINDVEFAVFEINGKISVLPKGDKKPLTPADINLKKPKSGLTKDLIMDGILLKENLYDTEFGEDWLMDQLQNHGIIDMTDVFYAGLDSSGKLYISRRMHNHETHGKYGIE